MQRGQYRRVVPLDGANSLLLLLEEIMIVTPSSSMVIARARATVVPLLINECRDDDVGIMALRASIRFRLHSFVSSLIGFSGGLETRVLIYRERVTMCKF